VVARPIIDIPREPPRAPPAASDDHPTVPRLPAGEGTQIMVERPVPRPRVPSFVPTDEATSDDATIVIPRRALESPRPPAPLEETTQHDPTVDEYDGDETIVESPSFLSDGALVDKATVDRR